MKFAFIGSVLFSLEMLKHIVQLSFKPEVVITQIDKGINDDYVDLEPFCKENNLSLLKTNDVNTPEIINILKRKDIDYIFCFGWSKLLKKEILEIPKHGVIGFHPTKLPENRGRHPLIWSLVLGLEMTASTFFFMDEYADSGDILSQREIKIDYNDDATSLYNKVILSAKEQLNELIPKLASFNYTRIPQDHSKANYWRKRDKEDGKIDFRMSSRAIYNLVRALSKPYAGAHLIYKGKEIKIWKVEEFITDEFKNIEPGKIVKVLVRENIIWVKAYDNIIIIKEHEFDELPKEGDYIR